MTLKEAVELQKDHFFNPWRKASGSAVCRNRLRMAPHTAPMSANALTTPWLCQRDSVSAPLILITRWDGVNSVKAMR